MFWMLALVMMVAAAPAFSGDAVQMWRCEMDDDATEAQLEAMAAEWLAAAKKVEGGANLKASVLFPVAVNATGEMDVMFVISAPTFAEWGTFWDNYAGSEAAKLEAMQNEAVVCPDSVLWEAVQIK
jgi:hypothetical protein